MHEGNECWFAFLFTTLCDFFAFVVNINDYSDQEIKGFGDALSLIMLIDKIRGRRSTSVVKIFFRL